MKNVFLSAAVILISFSFCGSALALSAGVSTAPTLFGSKNSSHSISVSGIKEEAVNCSGKSPTLEDSASMFDCLNGSYDFSLSGLFGFDLKGLMGKLKSTACNYANAQISTAKSAVTQPVLSAVQGLTGGIGTQIGAKIGGPAGQAIGGAVQGSFKSDKIGVKLQNPLNKKGPKTQVYNPFK